MATRPLHDRRRAAGSSGGHHRYFRQNREFKVMQASDGPISMTRRPEERRNWTSSLRQFVRAALLLFCVFLPFLTWAATPVWTSEAGLRFFEVSPPASGKSGF